MVTIIAWLGKVVSSSIPWLLIFTLEIAPGQLETYNVASYETERDCRRELIYIRQEYMATYPGETNFTLDCIQEAKDVSRR